MASTWVRELARAECRKIIYGLRMEIREEVLELKKSLNALKLAVQESAKSHDELRDDLKELYRRAGDFTGMSETEVSRLVSSRVMAKITKYTIDGMFEDCIAKYYGTADHPGFRNRFGLDDPEIRKMFERDDDMYPGSD